MTILVTGGTGFLGKNLVRRLVDDGRAVRVLVRSRKRLEGLPVERLEVAEGDVVDRASIARALQGVSQVIHAAALVARWSKDPGAFERVNVGGTRAVLEEAQRAGAQRIVHVSSFFALGCSDAAPQQIGEEGMPRPAATYTEYERTKMLAGRVADELQAAGAPLLVVYPGVVYGPGELTEANIVAGLLRDHLRGKLPGIPGDGAKKWTYAYVHDVVDGIVRALDRGAVGGRYILGGESATADEFFRLFAEVSGKRPPRLHLPYALVSVVGAFEELLARCCGKSPKVTRAEVATYRHHWAFSSERARRELGYAPLSLREGLKRTYAWLIEREPALRVAEPASEA
ncbi:MAG: NAD-dependent epimerase/dehydratase family protein [Planctomycetes bacterium]|nr:NAD-dependent epimerase/dehydratase family protein [Planctomycetota bacterium]